MSIIFGSNQLLPVVPNFTDISQYVQANIPSGNNEEMLSLDGPPSGLYRITHFVFSGDATGMFTLFIDGVQKLSTRISWTTPTIVIPFSADIQAGSQLKIYCQNRNGEAHNFNFYISVRHWIN